MAKAQTSPKARSKRTAPLNIRTEANRARALELRLAGWSYRRIADDIKLSHVRALQLVQEALAEYGVAERATELRAVELARLDDLTSAHWEKAKAGDIKATEIVLRIADRRSRLLGLDAPKRVTVDGDLVPPVDQVKIDAEETMAKIEQIIARVTTSISAATTGSGPEPT